MSMENRIDVREEKSKNGLTEKVEIAFGPHHFVRIFREGAGVTFVMGTTHHGFRADASEVNSQLEKIIYEVRETHPDLVVD